MKWVSLCLLIISILSTWDCLATDYNQLVIDSAKIKFGTKEPDSFTITGRAGIAGDVSSLNVRVGGFVQKYLPRGMVKEEGRYIFRAKKGDVGISEFTFDPATKQFSLSAAAILAFPFDNPVRIELSTGNYHGCTMPAFHVSDDSWNFKSSEGKQYPCYLEPLKSGRMLIGPNKSEEVTFDVSIDASKIDSDSVRLFSADQNGNPTGLPLCNMKPSADGMSFRQSGKEFGCKTKVVGTKPETKYYIVQARVNGSVVVSPSASIETEGPEAVNFSVSLLTVGDAAQKIWNKLVDEGGDKPETAFRTGLAIRSLPGVRTTEVSLDGRSIDIKLTNGYTTGITSEK